MPHPQGLAAAVAAFIAVPLLVVADSSGTADASVAAQAATGSVVTVSGAGAFSSLQVTVDQTQDLVRIPLKEKTLSSPVEALVIQLIPSNAGAKGELRFAWGTLEHSVEWSAK